MGQGRAAVFICMSSEMRHVLHHHAKRLYGRLKVSEKVASGRESGSVGACCVCGNVGY
jgi:hypothetical protein